MTQSLEYLVGELRIVKCHCDVLNSKSLQFLERVPVCRSSTVSILTLDEYIPYFGYYGSEIRQPSVLMVTNRPLSLWTFNLLNFPVERWVLIYNRYRSVSSHENSLVWRFVTMCSPWPVFILYVFTLLCNKPLFLFQFEDLFTDSQR